MTDIELAVERMKERSDLTLVLAKEGDLIFETGEEGLNGFLRALDELEEDIKRASAADRVVGKAVAYLAVYAGLRSVFGEVMSEGASDILKEYDLDYSFSSLVDVITDSEGEVCFFERVVEGGKSPEEAYRLIKAKIS